MPRPRLRRLDVDQVASVEPDRTARSVRRKPAIICRVVVLPQPEGPSSETNSPLSTASDEAIDGRGVAVALCQGAVEKDIGIFSGSEARMQAASEPGISHANHEGGACIAAQRSISRVPALVPLLAHGVDDVPVDVRCSFLTLVAIGHSSPRLPAAARRSCWPGRRRRLRRARAAYPGLSMNCMKV